MVKKNWDLCLSTVLCAWSGLQAVIEGVLPIYSIVVVIIEKNYGGVHFSKHLPEDASLYQFDKSVYFMNVDNPLT